ncbi:MAG: hypothetical protein SGI77_02990 [Pirellulaceae bacterium]|nr:hypothetical protein [Pirellulaceae bacterium]
MTFAPKHDWTLYEEQVSPIEKERIAAQTDQKRFETYIDYFDTLREAKRGLVDREALDSANWKEKLAQREKLIKIFLAMDAF